jgi:hypothetical protein
MVVSFDVSVLFSDSSAVPVVYPRSRRVISVLPSPSVVLLPRPSRLASSSSTAVFPAPAVPSFASSSSSVVSALVTNLVTFVNSVPVFSSSASLSGDFPLLYVFITKYYQDFAVSTTSMSRFSLSKVEKVLPSATYRLSKDKLCFRLSSKDSWHPVCVFNQAECAMIASYFRNEYVVPAFFSLR